ncbi:Protein CBG05933 [Caenorhabditis briggsae]|uniref:Protein CBG05933 n=1 Tax=Caenorhabditis briggsae TaxID=6238 RepID=A8X1A8_CAEBR|nr:Protein CBG05933 [Caenorhabditis briggsae]CAP26418.2 Protein CBG05933 [Caenorhabditis briggsae]
MASSYSTRSSRGPKSSADDGGFQKGFYGINGTVHNKGISLLKKKKKKLHYEDDIRANCKNMDHYKDSADKLHSALMLLLVESKASADSLATSSIPSKIPVDPGYQHCSDYLAVYESIQKHGLKELKLDSLDPIVKATKKLADEQEKYVRMQLETLKPLTKFISDEYWEFAKAKYVYQNALEKFENNANGNKSIRPGSMEPSASGLSVEKTKDDAKSKMMVILNKITVKKESHALCVIQFSKQASDWHKNVGVVLAPFNTKPTEEYKPKAGEGEAKSVVHSSRNKKVHRKTSKENSSR